MKTLFCLVLISLMLSSCVRWQTGELIRSPESEYINPEGMTLTQGSAYKLVGDSDYKLAGDYYAVPVMAKTEIWRAKWVYVEGIKGSSRDDYSYLVSQSLEPSLHLVLAQKKSGGNSFRYWGTYVEGTAYGDLNEDHLVSTAGWYEAGSRNEFIWSFNPLPKDSSVLRSVAAAPFDYIIDPILSGVSSTVNLVALCVGALFGY